MSTESWEVQPLEWRAAGHAALSDVGRLRVIDSIEVGDVSPRDLAAALGPDTKGPNRCGHTTRACPVSRCRWWTGG